MKLRIKGDSLRLRVAPSEMARLLETGQVEDTIHFGPGGESLTYALEHDSEARAMHVRYQPGSVAVVIPSAEARAWGEGEDVGIYGATETGAGRLDIAVEKDWACLDKSDAENRDTFPNPKQGASC